MPFEKNHEFRFVPKEDLPLDSKALSLKLRQGVREKVASIAGWQDELRNVIEDWVNAKLGDN